MTNQEATRREFLKFIGRSCLGATALGTAPLIFSACSTAQKQYPLGALARSNKNELPFTPLPPMSGDKVHLAAGFSYSILAKWGDVIHDKREPFGTNNDFLAFLPLGTSTTDGLLWVNHESVHPLMVSGYKDGMRRTKDQVVLEQTQVGGSILRVQQKAGAQQWSVVKNDAHNRRLTARTPIRFSHSDRIQGAKAAVGTLANCAGGVTPWGTVLTCEENYSDFYGEVTFTNGGKREVVPSKYGWEKFFPYPPEHYGWVVEVDPVKGIAQKLISLGRFAHEGATVRNTPDGRAVVYMGDDAPNRCLYKFIADQPGSLDKGQLFVANLKEGRWVSLDRAKQPILREVFKDQTEVLIRCRDAAYLVGGTPLARPEDIKIDPRTGAVYVVLTNNEGKGDYFGSILKVEEKDNDPKAIEFAHSVFLTGGVDSGFACPDNIAFDRRGGLWMTTDVSGKLLGKSVYEPFKNNSLFYIPLEGENAGRALRVAVAPTDAEFTGPCFSPDERTLFLSVQHPGEESKALDQLTSHWPDGGTSLPRSSVIAISGESLDRLVL